MKSIIFPLVFAVSGSLLLNKVGVKASDFTGISAVDVVAVVGSKTFYKDASNLYVSFLEFLQFCHANDMTTSSIESAEEQAAIVAYFNDTRYVEFLWLGGWDINNEGNWRWIDGDAQMSYTNWLPNAPNGGLAKNCAHFRPFSPHQWFDTPCVNDKNVAFCHKITT
ncbi:perlucin isoform X5 [Folsomia candida]|uniref:perlucin isoform X5 n=1 Tax=Folsomia candida TaxID=158441 RepID=UPI000B907764|nr:perlucin isoform X5 [Folsomia candida]